MTLFSDFAAALPAPGVLRERLRVLTALEAAFGSRWGRYAFDGVDGRGFERFRFENGGGDAYQVFLGPSSAFLRAFDHESPMSPYGEEVLWPGLLDGLPEEFEPYTRLQGDEKDFPALTLALWHDGTAWHHGDPQPWNGEEPELTDWMLRPLTRFAPAALVDHFGHYHSCRVDLATLEALVDGAPFDRVLVERFASKTDWESVEEVLGRLDAPTA